MPQERAIDGPAEYPMNAPATAPTGPRTTAPERAPSAASPARSPALAWNETKNPAIRVAISSLFIAGPRIIATGTALQKCGTSEDYATTFSPSSAGFRPENSVAGLPMISAMTARCH